ncbi:MAG: ABC transporter ATP-binding protein [Desulfomonile tiedjei]|nr:ABC transporter ATP-binding protein [Desulfomonile tiedjei]
MVIRTEKVSKHFGGLRAVDGVDFVLKTGQLTSIIGPNGAGKTTLFNLIAGVYQPTAGQVIFKDRDITDLPLHQVSRLGITKTYQINHIFPNLTVFENIRISAQSKETSFNFWKTAASYKKVNEMAERVLERVQLAEKRNHLASTLSHGERRYLEIGIALATEPEVLLLDEPTAGMSCAETFLCSDLIKELNVSLRLSIVLVEHDMSVVMNISDEVVVLNEGRVLAVGTPQEVSDNEDVQSVYLGEK